MTYHQDITFAIMGIEPAIDLRGIASTDFVSLETRAMKNFSPRAFVTDGVSRLFEWYRSYMNA
ncbi:MAG: hypothetical protein K9J74_05840 [Sulfuritalea sp.]|nr:hypothetical protein [Sulfuritalea sp.]